MKLATCHHHWHLVVVTPWNIHGHGPLPSSNTKHNTPLWRVSKWQLLIWPQFKCNTCWVRQLGDSYHGVVASSGRQANKPIPYFLYHHTFYTPYHLWSVESQCVASGKGFFEGSGYFPLSKLIDQLHGVDPIYPVIKLFLNLKFTPWKVN